MVQQLVLSVRSKAWTAAFVAVFTLACAGAVCAPTYAWADESANPSSGGGVVAVEAEEAKAEVTAEKEAAEAASEELVAETKEMATEVAPEEEAADAEEAAAAAEVEPGEEASEATTEEATLESEEVAENKDEAELVEAANPSTKAPALTTETAAKATTQVPLSTITEGVYTIASALRGSADLDVSGGSAKNGAKVQIYTDNTTPAQRWRLEALGNDLFKIVNVGSGKVLDVAGGKAKSGTKVQQYAWNGTKAQQWKIVSRTDGGFTVFSALSDKLVLDVSGANSKNGTAVQIWTNNGTPAQVWKFKEIVPVLENGVYTFTNVGSGKVLDEAGGNVNNATNVQQYSANGTVAQNYSLSYDQKTGYYTVISANSGNVLDVAGGSSKNGANVQLYTPNGTAAQKWSIAKNSDGSYTFRSARSGKALDVSGGSKKNSANVQVWNSNGTAAQKWKAAPVSNWLPDGIYNIVTSNNQSAALSVAKNATTSGANVQSAGRSDTNWAQNWVIVQDKDNPGYYTIRNLNSRMALDVKNDAAKNGTNVQQAGKVADAGQLWKPVITAGGIVWQSKLNSGYVLDMAGGATKVGTNAQLYTRNNTKAQKFRLKGESVGTLLKSSAFVVRNVDSNQVLDVSGASTKNGAAVQLYAANGSAAQKFRFGTNGSGYSMVNTNSYKAVDVDTNSKTKLQQYTASKAANQRWTVDFDLGSATFTIKSAYTNKNLDGAAGKLSMQTSASTDAQRWILQPTESDYFRVFLNSGHGWNSNGNGAYDTGARGNGVTEADFASALCDNIIKYGRELYGLDIVDSRPYKLAYWDRLPKAVSLGCSTIFSVHFDAGGGSGPMTMVGVDGRHPASLTFEKIMGKHLYAALPGLRHRGTFYRNDITCVNGSIPAVLVEVCFMDNPSDVAYYQAHKDTVARELAAGLYEASQQKSLRKSN